MKPIISLSLSILISFSTFSQVRNCASVVDFAQMQAQDPSRYHRFMDLEAFTVNYIANQANPNQRLVDPNGIITIPVVVHVLHRGEAVGTGRNITVAQIQSQIDVLNEDFRRLNANQINTPSVFAGVAADYGFEFRLACQDPNGNITNGVTRTFAGKDNFTLSYLNSSQINEVNTGIKFDQTGGKDAWPTDRYLNIWVASMTGGSLGYGTFPADFATRANVDGIVVLTTAMGRTGNVATPFHLGRTATHEIGHWLNLRHIWGDAQCGDDFVGDTPTQKWLNFGCPTFPHITVNDNESWYGPRCDPADPSSMFMNYMDYTDDACMNIFTSGQRLRGRAIFSTGGPRSSFVNNYFTIQHPGTLSCISKVVTLTNPMCLPVTWNVLSGPASIESSTNSTAVLSINGSGTVVLEASSGNYISDISIPVTFNPPNIWVDIQPIGSSDCYEQYGNYFFTINNPQSGIQYRWGLYTPSGGPFWDPNQNNSITASFSFNEEGSYGVIVYPYNGCEGTYSEYAVYVNPFWQSCDGYRRFNITISPNPVKGNLNVKLENEKLGSEKLGKDEIVNMDLYELYTHRLVKHWSFKDNLKQWRLNVVGVKKGLYVLQVSKGKYKQSKQVMIE